MTEKRKKITLNKTNKAAPTDVSFKQYRGTPYHKYLIFRKNADGKLKKAGTMLAPNDRLALAKAKYNFREAVSNGYEITVQRRGQPSR